MTASVGVRCERTDCDGTGKIDSDGCCDVCGRQPAREGIPADGIQAVRNTVGPTSAQRTGSGPSAGGATPAERSTPPASTFGTDVFNLPKLSPPSVPPSLLTAQELPEGHRRCRNCRKSVGRGRAGQPGQPEGVCSGCGQPYSFAAKLHPGEIVAERYEVLGCIAHGGQGLIYKARHRNLSKDGAVKFVALKGLLDTAGPDSRLANEAERRFLTSVSHPNIVNVVDHVSHVSADGVPANYIVMNFVEGVSLADLLRRRGAKAGTTAPLAPADGIRYMLRLLPALDYLHHRGLVFCDLKPDNLIATLGGDLVLVDLGGVRTLDDERRRVLSTPGFRAPEIDDAEFRPPKVKFGCPSVASDLFAVARTLAVLVLGYFPGITDKHRHTLPDAASCPLLAEHESLARLLQKGMAEQPTHRFSSAAKMAEALFGVLREIAARTEKRVVPASSREFTVPPHPTGEDAQGRRLRPEWSALPALRVDPEDPAAPTLSALPEDASPAELAAMLVSLEPKTVEVQLRLARAYLEAGPDHAQACRGVLDAIATVTKAKEEKWLWRVSWYEGLLALSSNDPANAVKAFDRVYSEMPGELAPQLALATAEEAAGNPERAAALLSVVSETDPTITCAAFGMARCREKVEARMEAYRRVKKMSAPYREARIRLIRLLVEPTPDAAPSIDELREASNIFAELDVDHHASPLALGAEEHLLLRRDILAGALRRLAEDGETIRAGDVLGCPLLERPLRIDLEKTYLDLARLTPRGPDRVRLVNEAHRVRPRTMR